MTALSWTVRVFALPDWVHVPASCTVGPDGAGPITIGLITVTRPALVYGLAGPGCLLDVAVSPTAGSHLMVRRGSRSLLLHGDDVRRILDDIERHVRELRSARRHPVAA